MANYLTYPFKVMRITQRYDGTTSHKPHMTGTPKEWALDEGEKDGGRGWVYCPCDRMKVVKLTGVGKPGTNAVYLTSAGEVDLANGQRAVVTLQLVHPNDDDLRKLKDGQIFTRGGAICREGNDGASAYHIHMAVGLGKIKGTGWQKNSNGRWVLVTTGGPIKPEDAFFIDPKFTKIADAKKLQFRTLPQGTVMQTTAVLNIRAGAGTTYAVVGQYPKGERIDVIKTKTVNGTAWGRTDKGWICLNYAKKVAK